MRALDEAKGKSGLPTEIKRRIAILGYDGVAAINVVGPLEAFSNARHPYYAGDKSACYRVSIIACTGGRFVSDSGVTFCASPSSDEAGEAFDTVIIPGGPGLLSSSTRAEVARWITTRSSRTRRIASICTGLYALASTGLVDGRCVTTHWEHARAVSQWFPNVKVEESALFLKDGKFYSSAGATAGIDLCLALIEEDFGRDVALHVARRLLVYLVRDGGQEQYSEPAELEVDRSISQYSNVAGRMGILARWITRHLGHDLRLDKLAKRAGLTKNDLWEHFSETFGVPPALFVKNLRFNEARRRLSRGDKAVDVARAVGLRDEYFNQEFRRRFGALPYEYQRRFGCSSVAEKTDDYSSSDAVLISPAVRASDASKNTSYQRPGIVSFTRCIRARRSKPDPE